MMYDEEMPYFMMNEDWYYYDDDEEIYKLTDKAPIEAVKSYIEFYNESDEDAE